MATDLQKLLWFRVSCKLTELTLILLDPFLHIQEQVKVVTGENVSSSID